jgi:hypothetical protein
MPIAAIIRAYSRADEGCVERWTRYVHESAVMIARQIEDVAVAARHGCGRLD